MTARNVDVRDVPIIIIWRLVVGSCVSPPIWIAIHEFDVGGLLVYMDNLSVRTSASLSIPWSSTASLVPVDKCDF